jgi:hypothetical protein
MAYFRFVRVELRRRRHRRKFLLVWRRCVSTSGKPSTRS